MITINKYKDYKKHKLVDQDIDQVMHIVNLSINALQNYLQYKPVQEIVSNLQNNKTLLEIYSRKFKKFITEFDAEKLKETNENS